MMSNTLLVQPENTYWHFLPESRCLQYGDGREVVVGETLRVTGSPVLCKRGLHASARAIDALSNTHGPIACLVTLGGEIAHGRDRSAAKERTVLWMVDATRLLRDFACDVAEVALERERECGREPDPRSWAAIEVQRRFLCGDASESERDTAGAAAKAAARDADDASNAAAKAAKAAANAAKAATAANTFTPTARVAYGPARAAWAAAFAAANVAAYADAARLDSFADHAAAYAAAYAGFNVQLTQMLLAAGQAQTDLEQDSQKEAN